MTKNFIFCDTCFIRFGQRGSLYLLKRVQCQAEEGIFQKGKKGINLKQLKRKLFFRDQSKWPNIVMMKGLFSLPSGTIFSRCAAALLSSFCFNSKLILSFSENWFPNNSWAPSLSKGKGILKAIVISDLLQMKSTRKSVKKTQILREIFLFFNSLFKLTQIQNYGTLLWSTVSSLKKIKSKKIFWCEIEIRSEGRCFRMSRVQTISKRKV